MPRLLESIDALARRLQRDVLMLTFEPDGPPAEDEFGVAFDYEGLDARVRMLDWLDRHGIAWKEVGPFAREDMWEGYQGQVYVDVPFDECDPRYGVLRDYLEPDQSIALRPAVVQFLLVPLKLAYRNAHHDETVFWERLTDNL